MSATGAVIRRRGPKPAPPLLLDVPDDLPPMSDRAAGSLLDLLLVLDAVELDDAEAAL